MSGGSDAASAAHLHSLLTPFRAGAGACPVRIFFRNGEAEAELTLPESWRVRLEDELFAQLRCWLQPENVRVIYG
jgi:DNA polymerase-3 subunit alpha